MTATRKDTLEFAVMMAQEFPTAPSLAAKIDKLLRMARRHGRLQENKCNYQVSKAEDLAEERLEGKIAALCGELGCRVKFGGDPRGLTVKLLLPSGRYNTWGGAEDGWGVPQ